jgi:4-amino-4-deoxy-L-arabinose transferase-like glycosyltransferase
MGHSQKGHALDSQPEMHCTTARRSPLSWSALVGAVVLIGLIRLVTLGNMALTDNTEARYAEIGWQMFHTGNWVTPQFYLQGKFVPFWGKPPLFFWMTALSYEMGGVSEWAARMPNFLIGAALVVATVLFGRKLWGLEVGALAGLILASAGSFFILSGACVLDMSLAATVSLAMMCFALFAAGDSKQAWWGRGFFLFLGLGCLAKGPVAVVLVGLALVAWLLLERRANALRELPWISGLSIAAIVACPWYIFAERATPGFLHYFLINEHLLRYVQHEYGDLYGNGRTQPYGASWVMLGVTFLPWSGVLFRYAFERWKNRKSSASTPRDTWLLYAICWGLTPAIFFTACRQILFTYVLPGFPGLALASAVILVRWLESAQRDSVLSGLRVLCGVLAVLLVGGIAGELILHASTLAVIVTVPIVALYLALVRYGRTRRDPGVLLTGVGLGAPLAIAIGLAACKTWVDEAYSTKTILHAVAQLKADQQHAIVVPLGDSCSADFYQEAALGGRIDHHGNRGLEYLRSQLHEPVQDVFVISTRDWRDLEPDLRDGLVTLVQTSHWVACQTKGSQEVAARITNR